MKPVPICIPLHPRGGKFRDNTELRFALRSIHKHFKDQFEIAIVGSKMPHWLAGVRQIEAGGLKSALAAAADAYPNGFFWYYDDCCLLRDTAAGPMRMTPASRRWMTAKTSWASMLTTIKDRLEAEGFQAWDYSRPHGPYWFDKGMVDEGFSDWPGMAGKFPWESWILSKRDWPRRHGSVKQYYGPFRKPPAPTNLYLNYNDDGNTFELRDYLQTLFPDPSPWEIEPPSPIPNPQPHIEMTQKKHAVSFSLFGDQSIYAAGMLENVALVRKHYPSAEAVVHVERDHYSIQRLREEGARVIEHDRGGAWDGLMWRFETGLEADRYEVVHFRDADSRIGPREGEATEVWLASSHAVHAMADHRDHKQPLNAGMWSVKTADPSVVNALSAIRGCSPADQFGDEQILRERAWPVLSSVTLRHSGNGAPVSGEDFPEHDAWPYFVGQKVLPRMEKTRFVVLSPEWYHERRARFYERLRVRGGLLGMGECEWWKASHPNSMLVPPSFSRTFKRHHWWAATCDHIRILEETLLDDRYEFLMLCEDDAVFSPDFDEYFWRAWAGAPADWRAFWLGRHDRYYHPTPVNSAVERCSLKGQGQSCTLWNRKGMLRFYDHVWHRRGHTIDSAFQDLRNYDPVGWYQPTKKLVWDDPQTRQQGRGK